MNCCGIDECIADDNGGRCKNDIGYHYHYNEEGKIVKEFDYINYLTGELEKLINK